MSFYQYPQVIKDYSPAQAERNFLLFNLLKQNPEVEKKAETITKQATRLGNKECKPKRKPSTKPKPSNQEKKRHLSERGSQEPKEKERKVVLSDKKSLKQQSTTYKNFI